MTSTSEKRARFHALHQSGCFVLPNPWDAGTARLFQHLGFAALASTSSGFAWSRGQADYAPSRDQTLAHLADLCAATDLPVNADYQSGFATRPEDVAANVSLAARTGVAGLSIEDTDLDGPNLDGPGRWCWPMPTWRDRRRTRRSRLGCGGCWP